MTFILSLFGPIIALAFGMALVLAFALDVIPRRGRQRGNAL